MKIGDAIFKSAKTKKAPDGKLYKSLSISAAGKISARCKKSLKEIEIEALEFDVIPEHYQRNIGTVGVEGQIDLLSSHVAIIGAGGLGGTVFEILARYGVGEITIADFDKFEESNLNRQLLSNVRNLKTKKVGEAAKRARIINPAVEIKTYSQKLTKINAHKIIEGADIVADCLGGLPDRFVVEEAAKRLNIPMVHAALSGFKGQLTTIYPEDEGLRSIYGPPEQLPKLGEEAALGTPPSSVMYMASLQAHEIIKILLNLGEPFRNKLVLVDLNDAKIRQFQLAGHAK